MKLDQSGYQFIAGLEGFTASPTNDNGHLMWGHGHDQQPGEVPPASITLAESDTLLVTDCATRFEPAVNHLIPPVCNQNQYTALCDFAYNEGTLALATMMHHGWDQIPVQILAWCWEHNDKGIPVKSKGLLLRRQKELALFNSAVTVAN